MQAIRDEGMLDNATARGQQLMAGVLELAKRYPIIDVRGRGLMVGLEFGGLDGSRTAQKGITGVSQPRWYNALCLVCWLPAFMCDQTCDRNNYAAQSPAYMMHLCC